MQRMTNSGLRLWLWLILFNSQAATTVSNYSFSMLMSIISREQGIMTSQEDSSALLQAGITQKALQRMIKQYPNHSLTEKFAMYLESSADSVVPFVSNPAFDTTYPLDRLSNGNAMITRYQESGNKTYLATLDALRTSIGLQPRNAAGGLWYYVYPNWSYLDGMYSFAPFAAEYATVFNETHIETAFNQINLQLDLLWEHNYDNSSGLLAHGYDYSKTAVWANPVTGRSPYVWGRSLGWYMMALVDTLEILSPYQHLEQWEQLRSSLQRLARALVKHADPTSGAWWQILGQPREEDNYIESSGSSMFVYALLKGERLGWLSGVEKTATRAYKYIVDHFVDNFGNGTLGWNGTVSVCSLNSTASYEYYISRPILYNSVLGSAAFVLASLEYELLP